MTVVEIADHQAERKAKLEALFLRRAEGKPWMEGIFPHQWRGACYGAVARRWVLGDDMGLGKTRTITAWADLVGSRRIIIMAEANVCSQFAAEFAVLAPHRTVVELNSLARDRRHSRLDELVFRSEGVAVVNFELFRQDREALGRLARWGADTLIVDEAHNLKATKTGNFRNAQVLTFYDNVCAKCGGSIESLYDEAHFVETGRKRPKACLHCGWKKGEETGVEYPTQLAEALATKSVQNLALLTGTPILNTPGDLYASLHLMDPVSWPTFAAYQKRYLIQNYNTGRWEWRTGALEILREELKGRFLARKKTDVGKLQTNGDIIMPNGIVIPAQKPHIIEFSIDRERYPLQLRTIRQITERAMIELSTGEQTNIMALIAVLTRKRQANVHPGGIVIRDKEGEVLFEVGKEVKESMKLDVLVHGNDDAPGVVKLWQEGKRQVVFSQFKTALEDLEERLVRQGMRVARLDGDTPKRQRLIVKADFVRDPKRVGRARYDVVLAQYRSGGTGLNFTDATETHILDEEWSPGRKGQAYARTHRIGQTQTSRVWVYRMRNTVDVWLANLLNAKEDMISEFEGSVSLGKADLKNSLIEAMQKGEIL